MRTQVTFDAANPHSLAAFWANALGIEVEDHSDLVDQLVADGRMPAADRITLDGRSAFREVAACRDPQGVEPRFFFQKVPERKIAKNRVHIDLHVEPDRKAVRSPGSRSLEPSSFRLTTIADRSLMSCAIPRVTSSACTDPLPVPRRKLRDTISGRPVVVEQADGQARTGAVRAGPELGI